MIHATVEAGPTAEAESCHEADAAGAAGGVDDLRRREGRDVSSERLDAGAGAHHAGVIERGPAADHGVPGLPGAGGEGALIRQHRIVAVLIARLEVDQIVHQSVAIEIDIEDDVDALVGAARRAISAEAQLRNRVQRDVVIARVAGLRDVVAVAADGQAQAAGAQRSRGRTRREAGAGGQRITDGGEDPAREAGGEDFHRAAVHIGHRDVRIAVIRGRSGASGRRHRRVAAIHDEVRRADDGRFHVFAHSHDEGAPVGVAEGVVGRDRDDVGSRVKDRAGRRGEDIDRVRVAVGEEHRGEVHRGRALIGQANHDVGRANEDRPGGVIHRHGERAGIRVQADVVGHAAHGGDPDGEDRAGGRGAHHRRSRIAEVAGGCGVAHDHSKWSNAFGGEVGGAKDDGRGLIDNPHHCSAVRGKTAGIRHREGHEGGSDVQGRTRQRTLGDGEAAAIVRGNKFAAQIRQERLAIGGDDDGAIRRASCDDRRRGHRLFDHYVHLADADAALLAVADQVVEGVRPA